MIRAIIRRAQPTVAATQEKMMDSANDAPRQPATSADLDARFEQLGKRVSFRIVQLCFVVALTYTAVQIWLAG
ncbi:hypothetical protein [Phenylobacterium sp.]|uniref:hypothetical protein n=1 Tax=Phenylobacterium sp. TaxID=1871053 RepID=UPI00272EF0AA|nr:hypothetical protein [Phenylobacterium sp.]